MRNICLLLSILIFTLIISNCATIMHGDSQYIEFQTQPDGLDILVDGKEMGQTPIILDLSTGIDHIIEFRHGGEMIYKTKLSQEISPWFWGNFATIMPLGMIVDYATGSIHRLEPSDIDIELERALDLRKNSFFIATNVDIEKTQ